MGRDRARAWPLLGLLLLTFTSCGGGGDVALSATQEKPRSTALQPGASRVVVRYDRDRDGHLDVLTLDASRNPLVIVEAIRGTADSAGVNATDTWRGGEVGGVLNDALQLYLAESCSVGTRTDLDLTLDGTPVTVTVIE